MDNASLDLIDFYGMFNDTIGALPFVPEGKELPRWPWSWKERAPPVAAGDGGGGAAAAAADEDLHLDAGLLATLQVEWSRFKAFTVTVEDKKLPYWIRTRPFWPDLSELMLLWLKAPISTACVERGFSFMTIMDSNTPAHEGSEGRARSPAAAARAHPLPATVSLRRRRSCRRGPAGSGTTPSTDPRAPPPQEPRVDTGEVRVEMRSGARHHNVGGSHGQPGWFARQYRPRGGKPPPPLG